MFYQVFSIVKTKKQKRNKEEQRRTMEIDPRKKDRKIEIKKLRNT